MISISTKARDASDWLSPILIKELRQGMRGRAFLGSFLLLQVAMIFCATGALLGAASNLSDQLEFFNGLFWFIIAVPLLAVLPLAGHTALGNEIKANTLELVYLTRMTPWRIVAGKWAALFAQGLLFAFSVLPYLVLRYFLGGVDLLNELATLGLFLVLCGVLTSVAVGFSAHNPWAIRGGFAFFLFFGLNAVMALAFSGLGSFGTMSITGSAVGGVWIPFLFWTLMIVLCVLLMFEVGTGKIAPAAMTRSFQVRGLGLLILGTASLFAKVDSSGFMSIFPIIAPPLLLICVFAVCESPRWIPSIYAPYARRGVLGRVAGWFFYPGWASGVFYTTLVMALIAIVALPGINSDGAVLGLLVVYAGVIFPVALTRMIRPETKLGLPCFLGIQIAMLFIALFVLILEQTLSFEAATAVTFLPTSLILLLAWDILPTADVSIYHGTMMGVIGCSLLVILFRAYPLRVPVREMLRRAAPAKAEEVA